MDRAIYRELMHRLSEVGAVKKGLARDLPSDLPGGSAGVLATLSQHGEMTMSELTDLLAVDISVTSRHVAYVAEQGWLERAPNPTDGRSRILRLTDAGRDLLDGFADHYADLLAKGLSDWSEDEVRELIRLMAKLHDSLACHRTATSGPAPACPPASPRATTHVRS